MVGSRHGDGPAKIMLACQLSSMCDLEGEIRRLSTLASSN